MANRIVTMKDVAKLPRHCTPGVARWLSRVDLTIADLVAGKLDTDRLREIGGFSANFLADAIERDDAALEAGSTDGGGESLDHKPEQDLATGGKDELAGDQSLVAGLDPEASRDGKE